MTTTTHKQAEASQYRASPAIDVHRMAEQMLAMQAQLDEQAQLLGELPAARKAREEKRRAEERRAADEARVREEAARNTPEALARAAAAEQARAKRDARRAIALDSDVARRNAAIAAMSPTERHALLAGGDLSVEELAEVMTDAPDDWFATWCSGSHVNVADGSAVPVFHTLTKRRLAIVASRLPERARILASADCPSYIEINRVLAESLPESTARDMLAANSDKPGQLVLFVGFNDVPRTIETCPALHAVLSPGIAAGLVTLTPLTLAENVEHESRLWSMSYPTPREFYPRRRRIKITNDTQQKETP